MKKTVLLSAALFAAACGGGKKDPDANLNHPDARHNPDAPSVGCTLETNITEIPDPTPDTGNTAVLRSDDGATPPNNLFVWNYVVLGTGAKPDLMQFWMPRPDPAAPDNNVGVDLDLFSACTSSVSYCLIGLGDYDFTTRTETQFFYPDTGTLRIEAAEDAVGGDFTVNLTVAARFDQYTAPGGTIIDSDGDGTADCNGTLTTFGPITIPVADPTALTASSDPRFVGKKWGKFQRD